MHLLAALAAATFAVAVSWAGDVPGAAGAPSPAGALTWRLPPTAPVARPHQFLVNYHHRSLPENRVAFKEERLAQWDVLILHDFDVRQERLSLERIRRTNPRVILLAWMPLQGPGNPRQQRGVPTEGPGDWYARRGDGSYVVPHWGGHLMNPHVQDRAWPRHVLAYIAREYLVPGRYDGVFFDCLWERPWPGMDVDGDGAADTERDAARWQNALGFLLQETRQRFPAAILTGNGGGVWSAACPYYAWVNGNMRENALGTQFGVPGWQDVRQGGAVCLEAVGARPAYHFIAADVRFAREQAAAEILSAPTETDLRRMRLGLGLTLLRDDQYFGFDRGDCLHGQLWWFKEYDADLGEPVESEAAGVYGEGTLSRVFSRGLVVVNTRTQAIRVTVPRGLRDVTTGAAGLAFDIPGEDARMLLHAP